MALRQVLLPRDGQPQELAEINRQHPLLAKALAVLDPVTQSDLVTGLPLTRVFGQERIAAAGPGIGFYCGPNARWRFTPRAPQDPTNNRRWSVFALSTILTTPTQVPAGIVGCEGNSTPFGLVTSSTATDLRARDGGGNTSIGTLVGGSTIAAFARSNTIAANNLQGGLSVNRSPQALSTGAGSAGSMAWPSYWELGGDSRAGYATSRYIEQVVHLVVLVNDYLQQTDFDALVADPRQLFEPQRIVVPVASGAPGGDATVTMPGVSAAPAVGALAATGGATAALAGVAAAPAVGAIAATGGAAVALVGVAAAPAIGAVSASAGATAALQGVAASPAVGQVAVQAGGSASVVLPGCAASPTVGALAATGAAQITLSGIAGLPRVGQVIATDGTTPTVEPIRFDIATGRLVKVISSAIVISF